MNTALLTLLGLLLWTASAQAGTRYWLSASGGTTAGSCAAASGATDPGVYMRTWANVRVCITGNDGDEVYFKDGSYGAIHETTAAISGSVGNHTVLRSVNPLGATLHHIYFSGTPAQYVTIERFTIDATKQLGSEDHCINVHANITIRDNHLKNCFFNGILLEGNNGIVQRNIIQDVGDLGNPVQDHSLYVTSDGNLIENNELINSINGYGVHLFGSGGVGTTPSNNIVRGNRVHGTFLSGAYLTGITASTNNVFYNNIAYSIPGGFAFDVKGSGIRIENNVVRSVLGGAPFRIQSSADIKNNAVDIYTSGPFEVTSGSPTFATNFCTSKGTGCAIIGGGGTNPARFADPANANFRLCTAAGVPHASCVGASPLIDVGTTVAVTNDIDGTMRPINSVYDIGAYESGDPGPSEPTPGYVAKWSLDNVATDSSGNSNTLTLQNGATYSASGKYNQALLLDGTNDYASAADSASLDLTHGFVLSAWVNPSGAMTDFRTVMVRNYKYFLYASSSGICGAGAVVAGYDLGNGTAVYACYSTPLTPNVWTHVSARYNRTSIDLLINGVVVTSAAASAFMPSTAGTTMLGGSQFGEYFPGRIDEAHVRNLGDLSTAQIATLMNTPIGSMSPLVVLKLGSGTLRLGTNGSLRLGQ